MRRLACVGCSLALAWLLVACGGARPPATAEGEPAPLPKTITRESATEWARQEVVRRARQPKLPAESPVVLHNIGILGKSKMLFYLGDPAIVNGRPGAASITVDNGTTAVVLDDSDKLKMSLIWVRLTSGPHTGTEGYASRSDVYRDGETILDPTREYR